jgi:uncharacterized repeat protein (TIGR03803 family)
MMRFADQQPTSVANLEDIRDHAGRVTRALDIAAGDCEQKAIDGGYPFAGVVHGKDDNFYGTTYYGGATGYGAVFKLTNVVPAQ